MKKFTVSVFTSFHDAVDKSSVSERFLPESKLAPWEQVKFAIDEVTEFVKHRDRVYTSGIATTSDHVVNGVRLCVKRGIISPDDVEIVFHGAGMVGTHVIHIGANGALSEYPDGFLDTWNKVILELI